MDHPFPNYDFWADAFLIWLHDVTHNDLFNAYVGQSNRPPG